MGYIYKIVCNKTKKIYFGSTKNNITKRLQEHESHYRRFLKGQIYHQSSIDILKNNDYQIYVVEECDNDNLKNRERYYIDNFDCVNIKTPTKTQKQWRDDNKDKIKKYREDNKDKFNNYNRIKSRWYTSMGGRPDNNNMSLLKIDPNLFLI